MLFYPLLITTRMLLCSNSFPVYQSQLFISFSCPFLLVLLAASTTPLVYDQYGKDLWCSILYNSMIIWTSPSKWDPLLEMISCGTPNWQIMLFFINRATCLAFDTKKEVAFTHLVKQLMATKMYSCPFEALGAILPITSMPHMEKGSSLSGTWFRLVCV